MHGYCIFVRINMCRVARTKLLELQIVAMKRLYCCLSSLKTVGGFVLKASYYWIKYVLHCIDYKSLLTKSPAPVHYFEMNSPQMIYFVKYGPGDCIFRNVIQNIWSWRFRVGTATLCFSHYPKFYYSFPIINAYYSLEINPLFSMKNVYI